CPLPGLTRVIDNLLNNATKAIPRQGGELVMQCYRKDNMAVLEVRNAGAIPDSQIDQIRRGEVKGRGLNIILRFVQANHGAIDIRGENGHTVTAIQLPLQACPAR
ncbi:MAG: ATP-binding protein, partial [Desulfobulbaceae bacterium]|nr:ATP-binding protein [Desulfobulbaceae bacterium]HIJ91757.1 sensor histidine kinase [Deltaproteobacteria bacterium]